MLGLVFIYCFLIGVQGFDLTDEGWLLCAYQQLFEHPQSSEAHMLYYNGILLGAIWNSFFSSWGILGFRLLTVLLRVSICAIVYILLRRIVNRWCILGGILILLICWHDGIARYHNLLSALLVYVSIYFICKSLECYSTKYMLIAGIVTGINIFTRFPNVMMCSLVLCAILPYFYNRQLKRTLFLLFYGILGVILGICFEFFLLLLLGHYDLYQNCLLSTLTSAASTDSTHSLWRLGRVYFVQYKDILKTGLVLCGYGSFALFCMRKISNRIIKSIILSIIIVMSIIYSGLTYGETPSIVVYAICFVSFFFYVMFNKTEQKESYLLWLTCLTMILFPLGSECGVDEFGTRETALLAFPMCCGLVFRQYNNVSHQLKIIIRIGLIAIVFPILFNGVKGTINTSFHDNGKRWLKTSKSKCEMLNVYSDNYKLAMIDEAIEILNNYVGEREYLLCWQSCPILNYLTHTYPYLNNPWPWTFRSSVLEKHFIDADLQSPQKPIVICNKSNIDDWFLYNSDWNSEYSIDQWNFRSEKIAVFHKFITENNYETVWENEIFRIMVPSSML